jgi:predicted ribosome quality control (RQC) complex YloA/Tae2 family protein
MSDAKSEPDAREALTFLWGSRVQRVDGPSPSLFAFTLYDRGQKQSLLLALAPRADLGLVPDRPSGQPASAFVRRLRVSIENARLIEAHWLGGERDDGASAICLSFLRGSDTTRVTVDFSPARPNLYLLGAGGTIAGAADERIRRAHFPGPKALFEPAERDAVSLIRSHDEALTRGSALIQQGARSSEQGLRGQARVQARAGIKRLTRKAAAIREDVARAENAPLMRREASLLLCHLHEIPAGSGEVELEDMASDPPERLRIKLDPAISAQANVERRFTRARRMQRGAGIAQARLTQTEAELSALSQFAEIIDTLDASSLIREAGSLGIKLEPRVEAQHIHPHKARQTHVPYRVFQGVTGARILVGKGAADNDALTLTIARPHDLWLHARGLHGAHVIVPRERGVELAPELLLDAAHLAVHFSDARGEASAEVQYVERRYLRKPKGSAPGAVRVDRERVLLLRIEPARLARLLANESSA